MAGKDACAPGVARSQIYNAAQTIG